MEIFYQHAKHRLLFEEKKKQNGSQYFISFPFKKPALRRRQSNVNISEIEKLFSSFPMQK